MEVYEFFIGLQATSYVAQEEQFSFCSVPLTTLELLLGSFVADWDL